MVAGAWVWTPTHGFDAAGFVPIPQLFNSCAFGVKRRGLPQLPVPTGSALGVYWQGPKLSELLDQVLNP